MYNKSKEICALKIVNFGIQAVAKIHFQNKDLAVSSRHGHMVQHTATIHVTEIILTHTSRMATLLKLSHDAADKKIKIG